MLVYNVFDMSASATPTRPSRGVAVPGIDTRGPAEKALAFSGWPLTPPQSAHDSRRPSLAYSALSDASHSGPSSISGYSQPATPVHSMAQSQDFTAQWTDGVDLHTSMAANMDESCQNAHLGQPMFGVSFQQPQMTDPQSMPMYSSVGQDSFASTMTASPARNAWTNTHQQTPSFTASAGLSFGQECSPPNPGYHNADQPFQQSFEQQNYSQFEPTHASLAPSVFQQPQHVVPSQINAQDDFAMETTGYGAGEHVHDGYTQSFDSMASGYSDFYSVGPASPIDAYCDESDPESVHIKNEYSSSPSRGLPTSRSRQPYAPYNASRVARKGSRSGKRSRKSQHEGKAWYEKEVNGTIVRCEGKPFEIKNDMVITHESKDSKPHRCVYEDEDSGQICDRRFERSEHLKRHMSMHSKERAYPCPLPFCNKEFSRPDNTGDHFKTHLRPNAKGRRNKSCNFHDLEKGILQQYDEKTASKLLNNLRKWLAVEEPIWHAEEMRKAYGQCTL